MPPWPGLTPPSTTALSAATAAATRWSRNCRRFAARMPCCRRKRVSFPIGSITRSEGCRASWREAPEDSGNTEMPTVTIALNGRNYDIAVGDGEEPRVHELANEIRRRMENLTRTAGPLNEGMVFVMTALLLADELDQKKREATR